MSTSLRGLLLFCTLLFASAAAYAQSTFGSIRGTVTDGTGAAVPNATAELRSLDQSTTRSLTADAAGAFSFENLNPGHYAITVTASGFSPTQMNGLTVDARQTVRVAPALAVTAEATTVEVSGAADQINTEDATLADSKNNALITQLPLNTRASTTSPLGALTLSANVQQDSNGYIALGGASSSMVNFSVDGISTANVRSNGALQDAYPSQEGIAAVKVTAFNNSAEFSQVGDVTFTTKSGTNQFHGSAFEYLQNNALDADPYGFSGKLPKHFNTFGGSLGGPVAIPHLYGANHQTFFFADYEGNRRSTAALQQFLVPSAADRSGDLTDIGGPTITNINPTAAALLKYYPLPNVSGNSSYNYENFQPTPSRTDGADLRLDQNFGSRNLLYGRFSRKNIASDFANAFLPNDIDSIHNRSLLVSDTFTITPRLVNEARYGFTDVNTQTNFAIEGAQALSQLQLAGVDISQHPLTHAFPTFNFNAGTGFTPIGRDKTGLTQSKTTQVSDNISYVLGKHTLKAGFDLRRLRYFDLESFAPEFASDDFGNFNFQPTFTNNAFGDFLIGAPTTLYFAVSSPDVGGTATQYSVFAQDEFQVSSRFTLSYGMRWQVLPSFHEDGGNLANFDQYTNSIVVPDELQAYLVKQNIVGSNLAFQQSFNACNLGQGGACTKYVTASQDGLPQGLRRTYMGNIQPRVAFAYRPFNDSGTVVRGGFGVYTITNLGPLSFNNSGNPTSNLHVYANSGTAAAPLIQFPNTAPPSVGVVYGGGGLDQGADPRYRDPQAEQWSLTVERQIGANDTVRASYVGMHTFRLSITEDLNQIPASTIAYNTGATAGAFVDTRAPYQNWSTLYSTLNAGTADYQAMELQASHRMNRGLYFDANYTWAKNLADNQGDTPNGFAGEVNYGIPIADRFNVARDYGNVEGTRRQRFLLTGVYQLPVGMGRAYMNHGGLLSKVVGGWDVQAITLIETGPWLTPSISPGLDQSNTNVTNRGAYARPDVVSSHYYAGQSRARYFNLNAFAPVPVNAGRFGDAGVGILQGPPASAVALGLAKNVPMTERVNLRFESTFTNVLNHTNFAAPATQVDNTSTFGQLTAPTTAENAGNRTGQVALRLEF